MPVLIKKTILMSPKKVTTLNRRVNPAIKETINIAANFEQRSVTNMIEMLIPKHGDKEGTLTPEQLTLCGDADE